MNPHSHLKYKPNRQDYTANIFLKKFIDLLNVPGKVDPRPVQNSQVTIIEVDTEDEFNRFAEQTGWLDA